MNNQRRKQIEGVRMKLDELQSELSTIAEEEREYFDNMPENLQGSDRGQMAEQAADQLDEAGQQLEEALSQIDEASA